MTGSLPRHQPQVGARFSPDRWRRGGCLETHLARPVQQHDAADAAVTHQYVRAPAQEDEIKPFLPEQRDGLRQGMRRTGFQEHLCRSTQAGCRIGRQGNCPAQVLSKGSFQAIHASWF